MGVVLYCHAAAGYVHMQELYLLFMFMLGTWTTVDQKLETVTSELGNMAR